MKTLVVYRSKSGFAKEYAEWIAEALQADLLEYAKVRADMFAAYDAVVYGGGLYVGGINGVKLIIDNMDKLEGKRLAVFASGATPPRKEALAEVTGKNFTPEQLIKIRFFYLRGGFDYSRLGILDKFLMVLLKLKIGIRKKTGKKLLPDELGMLEAFEKPMDFTKRKNIEALVEYIRGHSGTAAATTL